MTEIVLIVSLLLNILMVVVVSYLVYKSDQVLSEFKPFLREGEQARQAVGKKANEVLARTIGMSSELIKNSVEESKRNMKLSEEFRTEIEGKMRLGVEQTLTDSRKVFQNQSKDIISTYQTMFSVLNREVSSQTKKKVEELIPDLQKQLEQVPKMVEEKLGQELSRVDRQVEVYKQEKLKQVDSQIYQVINDVARATISRSVDISAHEELVMEALEKAKKENIFEARAV
jgi:hypothetical protein